MIKVFEVESHFEDEPSVTIISSGGYLQGLEKKAAADTQISQFMKSITPAKEKMYLHILAMGAGEYYGANRNNDFFPEEQLRKWHHTFVTSPAHLFKHHINKDPSIAIGRIIFSFYNERMHRVELIGELDLIKGADIAERLNRGEFPAMSMACKTPFDECSICGNKASTRENYCIHLAHELGRLYPDGKKVMAINSAELRFFDQSFVIRPADPTSAVMQKLASAGVAPLGETKGSAQLAEELGYGVEKSAGHYKLSEFIKKIEDGQVMGWSHSLEQILSKVKDPSTSLLPSLAKFPLGTLVASFAELGISPSLKFLSELIGYKIAGDKAAGIGEVVEAYLHDQGLDGIPISDTEVAGESHPEVMALLSSHVKQASLFPQHVTERAMMGMGGDFFDHGNQTFVRGTGVGQSNLGPYVEPTPEQRFQQHVPSETEPTSLFGTPLMKTLLHIAGTALLIKWAVNRAMARKEEELKSSPIYNPQNLQRRLEPGVKIVLVKSASENFTSALKLAEFSFARELGAIN